ncbi:MAG: hypothetical protein WDN49_09940 [Acetobacteraceae bacterium]
MLHGLDPLDQRRERVQERGLEESRQADLWPELLFNPRKHACRQERMSADVEEIRRGIDKVDVQHLLPNERQTLFRLRQVGSFVINFC